MVAVEMTGSAGEPLQVATGKKATMTMPIPASIMATAPATIPLWHFDEVKGLWVEEGQATKTGNTYVGEVSHFSYWNCDVPSNYVQFNCTIVDASGAPVSHALVKVSLVSQPSNAGWGYTDSTGYTGGAVPNNANLLLEVLGDWGCNTALYSQTFTTTNVNISLGTITIPASNIATVTGNIINCSANAVTNGYIIMNRNGVNYHYSVSNTGAFSFTAPMCGTTGNNVMFIAEDVTALQQSTGMAYTLTTGTNAIGTLTACGVSTQEYVNYTVNGTPYSFTSPADSIYMTGQGTIGNLFIYAFRSNNDFVNMQIDRNGIAVGSVQQLIAFSSNQTQPTTTIVSPVSVNITEYGAVGEFIAGNFTGQIGPPPNLNVVCNFRVRRTF
jgi:hypothetical protein